MPRTPKPKIREADASFSPEGMVICPHCFSRPSHEERRAMSIYGKRGWTPSVDAEPLKVGREMQSVVSTTYPCANTACLTHITVRCLLAKVGYREGYAPFAAKRMLKGKQAEHFARGVIGRDGIWRENGVPLVVAPVAPPPKETAVTKKPPKPKARKKPAAKVKRHKKSK